MDSIKASAILSEPPCMWRELAAPLSDADLARFSTVLRDEAQRAILLSEYLGVRSYGTDHAKAVKLAQAKLVKVRKALGFSYPKDGLATVKF